MPDQVLRYILVPCYLDDDGYCSTKNRTAPFGSHHIIASGTVGDDRPGNWLRIATLSGNYSQETALAVARVIAGDKPVVVDDNFYATHLERGWLD